VIPLTIAFSSASDGGTSHGVAARNRPELGPSDSSVYPCKHPNSRLASHHEGGCYREERERESFGAAVMKNDGLRKAVAGMMSLGILGAGIWQMAATSLDAGPKAVILAGSIVTALGIFFTSFLRSIWTELEPRWSKACADWLDAGARKFVPDILSFAASMLNTTYLGFTRRYLQQVVFRHRVFNVRGLRTQGTFTLELERIFVDLRISPWNQRDSSGVSHARPSEIGNVSIWSFLTSTGTSLQYLAVIGPPGSGKTTLLQHLALTFAQQRHERYNPQCPMLIPILLFLRDYKQVLWSTTPPSLSQLATQWAEERQLRVPLGWFERRLKRGKCLVLLDGLDEIPDLRYRKKVTEWVDQQIEEYSACRFIITSRPHGYRSNPLKRVTMLEVLPFTIQQITSFVAAWYLETEALTFAGRVDAGVVATASESSADLVRRVTGTPALAKLAVNPLLLTMITMVHRYRGALPGRRVELYGEICDVLLGHWQAAKGIEDNLTPGQKRAVLQPLALYMMEQGIRDIPQADAVLVASEPLARVASKKGGDPLLFFQNLENQSGLFLEVETGRFGFAHLTFQEYLAASQIIETHKEEHLVKHVHDPWWFETIRLYAGQADASNIIQACLDEDDKKDIVSAAPRSAPLALAYECLGDARTVEPGLREQTLGRILSGLEDKDSAQRRLAARVLLSIRLRNLLRLSDSLEIDTAYISCAEYALFVDEVGAAGAERFAPEAWKGQSFPRGAALQPVVGVAYEAALAFCAWVSTSLQSEGNLRWSIRLPRVAETRLCELSPITTEGLFSSLHNEGLGFWCHERRFAGFGIPPALIDEWNLLFLGFLAREAEKDIGESLAVVMRLRNAVLATVLSSKELDFSKVREQITTRPFDLEICEAVDFDPITSLIVAVSEAGPATGKGELSFVDDVVLRTLGVAKRKGTREAIRTIMLDFNTRVGKIVRKLKDARELLRLPVSVSQLHIAAANERSSVLELATELEGEIEAFFRSNEGMAGRYDYLQKCVFVLSLLARAEDAGPMERGVWLCLSMSIIINFGPSNEKLTLQFVDAYRASVMRRLRQTDGRPTWEGIRVVREVQ
jgi:energy-coupling factor transporter ATP-binding protein EcfA2